MTFLAENFDETVWRLIRKIPRGKVSTYKMIAAAMGNPAAARAVGNACSRNPFAPNVPCHRVVKSNGSLGGYAKGTKRKAELLKAEGVKIKNNKVLSSIE